MILGNNTGLIDFVLQVIDNDRGVHMRPMPGLVGLGANAKVRLHFFTLSHLIFQFIGPGFLILS